MKNCGKTGAEIKSQTLEPEIIDYLFAFQLKFSNQIEENTKNHKNNGNASGKTFQGLQSKLMKFINIFLSMEWKNVIISIKKREKLLTKKKKMLKGNQ